MSELLNEVNKFELDEGFSPKEIKMAIGIASDPRYKGGNMTGAVTAIDKVKKGLSNHPKVAAVLRRQNEDIEEAVSPAQQAAIAISKKEKAKEEGVELDEYLTPDEKKLIAKMYDKKGNLTPLGKKVMDYKIKKEEVENTEEGFSSDAQRRAAFASGYKEKDKKDKKEGNAFGMALKSAKDKGDKTFVVSGKTYNVEDYNVEEGLDIENELDYTVDEGMSPKAKAAASYKARMDKKFAPGGSYQKGADSIRKMIAKDIAKRNKKEDVKVIEGYFDEQKSSTGYDLYHKDFSGAMQHAYAHAKKKLGITIDPDEISDKVATGPRKPSKGKTNSYKLKGDKGSVQIQVYNMGSKYELNMYKESIDEEVKLDEITNKFAVVSVKSGDVLAFASDEKDAISLSKNNLRKEKGKVVKLKRGIATNRASKMIGRPLEMGMAEEVENKELDEGKKKPVSQMTPKEKAADAARRKEYKDYQKSKREEVENEELDEAQIAALTKANIKHTVKQHPMKKSKTMVNVSRKDYKAAEKALGKEASSQSDNIMLGISESVKLGGMPAGLSKERIKADRDVYAQVLGIKEALDPADFDISATDKDKDNAKNNIIIQLRKVITLRGQKPVEFANGKKEKVHPNVATAALSMHQKLRRTDEKDAFQQKIAKSYRDLLNAVKGK